MPLQEKNIKGFSVLELVVVLTIVAIISGVAYPNFSEWNKERAVRSDVDKIAALIKNTYTQTERGALAYVQIYFNQTSDGLFVEGRGLTMSTLATKINNGDDDSMLLMWCPNSQSKGTIFRLDPNENGGFDRIYETKISLLVEDYLPGTTVNYLLGAYNEFLKISNDIILPSLK